MRKAWRQPYAKLCCCYGQACHAAHDLRSALTSSLEARRESAVGCSAACHSLAATLIAVHPGRLLVEATNAAGPRHPHWVLRPVVAAHICARDMPCRRDDRQRCRRAERQPATHLSTHTRRHRSVATHPLSSALITYCTLDSEVCRRSVRSTCFRPFICRVSCAKGASPSCELNFRCVVLHATRRRANAGRVNAQTLA